MPLREETGKLVGDGVSIPLTPAALGESLSQGEIIPGMFLILLATSLLGGVACAGGFNQMTYFNAMRDSWASLLREHGEHDEARSVDALPIPLVTGPALAFVERAGAVVPATGVDLLAAGGLEREHFRRVASCTMADLLEPQLPEIARAVLGANAPQVAVAAPPSLVVCNAS
jgi:hypothetical protein